MLSFEISAMDLVLLVVMLMLLLLLLSQRKSHPAVTEPRSSVSDHEKLMGEPVARGKIEVEESFQRHSAEGFQKCIHQFGYLMGMPKNTSIPDECFGCPKVLRCMFPNEYEPGS